MIQQMFKEEMITDKLRDKLKDMTFDEDQRFLALFKSHTEQGEDEMKND